MFGSDDIFKVGVVFELIDKISKPLKNIEKLSEDTQKALKSLYGTSKQLANIGKDLAMVGGGISAAFALPVASSIQLEKQVYEFNKVVGASQSEIDKFTDAFMKMSSNIPIATDEIFALSASLSQMGIPKKQLIEFTEMVSKAAFAFDMVPEEAGKAFGEIKSAFSIPTIEALKDVGDTINYLSNTMGAAATDIIDILKRVGASAKGFGIQAKYMAVFGATIKEAGIGAEEVASGLRVLLTRTQAMDKGFLDVLSSIGMTKDEFLSLKKQDPSEALIKVFQAVKKLDSTKQTQLLKNWIGMEHIGKVQILINNLDRLKQKLKEVQSGAQTGSMQGEFETLTKSTAAQIQLLWNNIKNIASMIGSIFLPPLNILIQTLNSFIAPIATLINHHKTLASIILLPIGAFGALTLVIGGLLGVMGLLGMATVKGITSFINLKTEIIELNSTIKKELIPSLNAAFAKLNLSSGVAVATKTAFLSLASSLKMSIIALRGLTIAAIQFIFTPIGITLTGIALAGALIYKNWDKVKSLFKAIYNYLYLDRIKAFWMGFKEAFKDIGKAIKPLKDAFSNLNKALEPIFKSIGKLFGFEYSPNNNAFIIFARAGILAGKMLISAISLIANTIAIYINSVVITIKFISEIPSKIKHTFENIKNFLKSINLSKIGTTIFSIFINSIKMELNLIENIIKHPFNLAINFLKSINLFEIGKNIIEGLINGMKSVALKPVEAAKKITKNIVGGIKNFLGIKSPSKVFMEIGLFSIQGLIEGLKNNSFQILENAKTLTEFLIKPFKGLKLPIFDANPLKVFEKLNPVNTTTTLFKVLKSESYIENKERSVKTEKIVESKKEKSEKKSITVYIKELNITTQAKNAKELAQEIQKELEQINWEIISETI